MKELLVYWQWLIQLTIVTERATDRANNDWYSSPKLYQAKPNPNHSYAITVLLKVYKKNINYTSCLSFVVHQASDYFWGTWVISVMLHCYIAGWGRLSVSCISVKDERSVYFVMLHCYICNLTLSVLQNTRILWCYIATFVILHYQHHIL